MLAPVELWHAFQAMRKQEERRIQEGYEVARFEAILIINPTLAKEDKIESATDYLRFPWEKKQLIKVQSVEEMKKFLLGMASAHNARFNRPPMRTSPPVNFIKGLK